MRNPISCRVESVQRWLLIVGPRRRETRNEQPTSPIKQSTELGLKISIDWPFEMDKAFCVVLMCSIIIRRSLGQILFPEQFETDKKQVNLQGRLPLFAPTHCGEHQLLYPGDQADDWICDCAPAAVYHPETDRCYPAFRQGPCEENEMLVLGINKIIPECIPNECQVDGQVRIMKVCYTIGTGQPCANAHLTYVLGVDPETLKLDCVKLSINLQNRFNSESLESPSNSAPAYDLATVDLCARGSKRRIQGICSEAPKNPIKSENN